MEKKILVSENKHEIAHSLRIVEESIIPGLNKVKDVFEKHVGPFTEDMRIDLFEGGRKKVDEILQSKIKDLSEDASTMLGFYARQSRDRILREIRDSIVGFNKLCDSLSYHNLLEFVIFDDEVGNFIVTQDKLEELKDLNRTYVSTDEGIKLYNAHMKAAEALKEFFVLSKRDTSEITQLFSLDNDNHIIPAELDYDFLMGMSKK
jgi:hypothetical protein